MKFREQYKYAMIVPSSMGVRLTPVDRQPVHTSEMFHLRATSAETNVLSISSGLGLPVKVLTTFVKGSPIAQLIKNELKRRHIDYEGVEVIQDTPWGYRHQFNIADSGYGMRGPRVQNDRAGEVGKTLNLKDFDLDRIFKDEGVQLLHLSGLIAALSPETGLFCLELARIAKKHGTKISFDLNHRASFWKDREEELSAIFKEIASVTDILIGNEEDFQLALGIHGPEAGGKNIGDKIDSFKQLIMNVKKEFPNATTYATTLRQVESANEHYWGAILLDGSTWTVIEPRNIPVLDRIGGGDGFVGGLLYGFLKGWSSEKCAQFGWATGALATTLLDDFALPADEEQVWSIWEGNARVKR
ncbi:sugar kinase [Peloplasma aerotolerans]|uniref:Sugar kinase n=1 Tax=Peloplasma aerotolerans TaxID=3044389 RepID=A0AAW6UA18_9MOLU|nr:sugar kinase [Mariniplasma sp. M4Ah]MDI6453018.1 sugar kinase [Mariniplasma sp. M4Ah]